MGTVTTVHLPGSVGDTVVAQSPSAEAEGVSSPKVNLVVASSDADAQALLMPDLVGRSLDDATRVVVSNGLRVGKVSTVGKPAANTVPQGDQSGAPPSQSIATLPIVVGQAPAAGQKIMPNGNVTMDVVR
jgi:beta-lactam-binding protein with PASTA domain